MLTYDHLASKLAPRPFRFFETIASTQDEAIAWLKQGAPQGAVVIADEQRAGRGRMGRTWHTPAGVALALSFILKPSPEQARQVFMAGAVATAEMLENLGIGDVSLKWANDVRIGNKKVCGVLPEALWQGDRLEGVVLGIGVNVRVDFAQTDLAQIATSIETVLHHHCNRTDLTLSLLAHLDHWMNYLGTHALYTAWRSRLDTLGKMVTVEHLTGIATDVTPDGALILTTADGASHTILAGDLS